MSRAVKPRIFGVRECLALLRSVSLGRLVFTEQALPAIRPVYFVVDDEDVLIWSCVGDAVAFIQEEVVAFEADQIDPRAHVGWSVVVLGKADVVADPTRESSTSDGSNKVIRVHIDRIYGRQLCLRGSGDLPIDHSSDVFVPTRLPAAADQERAYQPNQSRLDGDK